MHDLTIDLSDRPGALADLGEGLAASGVSVEGGGVFTTNGGAVAHYPFRDDESARAAVAAAGSRVTACRAGGVAQQHAQQSRDGSRRSGSTSWERWACSTERGWCDGRSRPIAGRPRAAWRPRAEGRVARARRWSAHGPARDRRVRSAVSRGCDAACVQGGNSQVRRMRIRPVPMRVPRQLQGELYRGITQGHSATPPASDSGRPPDGAAAQPSLVAARGEHVVAEVLAQRGEGAVFGGVVHGDAGRPWPVRRGPGRR
jgi:hypothetical protein